VDEAEFKRRTRKLGSDCVALCRKLPREPAVTPIVEQLVEAATSIGANYRASCRGRSLNEIISKLSIVEEEADETAYWLEILVDAQIVSKATNLDLHREANEIVAMVVASKRTLKSKAGTPSFARMHTPIVNRES